MGFVNYKRLGTLDQFLISWIVEQWEARIWGVSGRSWLILRANLGKPNLSLRTQPHLTCDRHFCAESSEEKKNFESSPPCKVESAFLTPNLLMAIVAPSPLTDSGCHLLPDTQHIIHRTISNIISDVYFPRSNHLFPIYTLLDSLSPTLHLHPHQPVHFHRGVMTRCSLPRSDHHDL